MRRISCRCGCGRWVYYDGNAGKGGRPREFFTRDCWLRHQRAEHRAAYAEFVRVVQGREVRHRAEGAA